MRSNMRYSARYATEQFVEADRLVEATRDSGSHLLASLYGVSDEVHQAFVPFRNSSWLDWLADTVGAVLGVTALHRMASLRPMGSIPDALP